MADRTMWKAELIPDTDYLNPSNRRQVETWEEANLISSLCTDGLHKPVIDVDKWEERYTKEVLLQFGFTEAEIGFVPSSTPGHFHVYIDRVMTWVHFEMILTALCERGMVEVGYLNASRERKMTFVRRPGIQKEVANG